MDLFNLQRMNSPRFSYQVRQERIKREGSPYFTYTVPVTATTASVSIYVPTQFPDSRKYEPLDWLEIINNDVQDITVRVNDLDSHYCPAGVVRTIKGRALWHIRVTNDGAANTVLGKIVLTMRRQPQTIDQWAKRQ